MENMEQKAYADTLHQYQTTLNALNAQCSAAEKTCIVAETNLENLQNQLDQLVANAESTAGCKLGDIPALLAQEKQKLAGIMSELSSVDLSGNVTQETLDTITEIAKKYNIDLA